jgi:hypothetical protein
MESRGESPSTPAGGVRRPRGADPLANRSHLAGEKPRHRSLDVEKQRKLDARNARAAPAANDRVQAIFVEAGLLETVRLPCREKHARRDRVRLDHTDRHVGKQDRDVFRLIAPEVERVAMIAESDRTRGRQQGSAGGKNSLQVADGASPIANVLEHLGADDGIETPGSEPLNKAADIADQVNPRPRRDIDPQIFARLHALHQPPRRSVDVPRADFKYAPASHSAFGEVGLDELEAGVVAHGVRNVGGLGNSIQRGGRRPGRLPFTRL